MMDFNSSASLSEGDYCNIFRPLNPVISLHIYWIFSVVSQRSNFDRRFVRKLLISIAQCFDFPFKSRPELNAKFTNKIISVRGSDM